MSAPETNIEKQKRRRRPALFIIGAAVLFGAAMFILNLSDAVDEDAPQPEAAATD